MCDLNTTPHGSAVDANEISASGTAAFQEGPQNNIRQSTRTSFSKAHRHNSKTKNINAARHCDFPRICSRDLPIPIVVFCSKPNGESTMVGRPLLACASSCCTSTCLTSVLLILTKMRTLMLRLLFLLQYRCHACRFASATEHLPRHVFAVSCFLSVRCLMERSLLHTQKAVLRSLTHISTCASVESDDAHHTLEAVLRSCHTSYRGLEQEDVSMARAFPQTFPVLFACTWAHSRWVPVSRRLGKFPKVVRGGWVRCSC